MLFVLSAPSGAGKTTIAHRIIAMYPQLKFSVSATTRPIRPREQHGIDYFFLSNEEFQQTIARGGFVEWEEIFSNFYGTLKSETESAIETMQHILFDVDVKGALSIQKYYPSESTLIFIEPPDLETLRMRLLNRGTDSETIISKRIKRAKYELSLRERFDYVIINKDLSRAITEVAEIVERGTTQPHTQHA